MRTLLGWLFWTYGVGVAAGLALHATLGDEVFLGRYTGYVMPWLLAGLVPGFLWALRARRRRLAAVLGLAAIAIAVAHAPRFAPRRPSEAPAAAATLSVMSFNTWSRNADAARIAALVAGEGPDLVLLQETPPAVFLGVAAALRAPRGPYAHVAWEPDLGQAVLSRFPLESLPPMKRLGQA
ncbi:MAG TPA: endonuclease/exonuclease/phosphatase family protein, partial [Anaeromyxobacteraceae bacterium]|nr:endonuclease/exonuclease/phosphatase family protein [Anaeromyxobacteraceae bacterium]